MSTSTCIVFDEHRCVNCKACEIHCRQWHGISVPLCRQLGGMPALAEGKVRLPLGFVTCVHCTHPACLRACAHRRSCCGSPAPARAASSRAS